MDRFSLRHLVTIGLVLSLAAGLGTTCPLAAEPPENLQLAYVAKFARSP
jgi:hypothetical protein